MIEKHLQNLIDFDSIKALFSMIMMPTRQINRAQVEAEGRAKVTWGDSREEVLKFFMIQGLTAAEAVELADGMFRERALEIRGLGIKRICIGVPLMAVPVAAWFYFLTLRIIPVKLFALTVMVGLYGLYLLLSGVIMFVAPKSEPGDLGAK